MVSYDNYLRPMEDGLRKKYFRHCRFKGGTTVTNNSTYTPTEYELQLQKSQADYANAIAPNSLWLNDTARKILENSIGSVQVDFNKLNDQAQQLISQNQQNLANLAPSNTAAANKANATLGQLQNGILPSQYQTNMQNAIRSTLQNTMGTQLNNLANRGVLNSSVTSTAMNDISKNAADTVAQQYQNNIQTVGGLANRQMANTLNANSANAGIYGNLINSATQPITTAASAQEAAQKPALNLWNASLGLNGSTTSALAAAAGKGTTTSTSHTSGGGGLLSGLMGGLL
ncbi:MAG: hypothetical protein MR630_11545 [Selenomonas sp.]|uniref:hypothetical protein n=1 Tax=Selenomonas sp. TaxID=2053611 RepID=UPI0025DE2A25|nr:hypothetical protein [Selenomonas sp.]MCI6233223.1 hypothetical protein [Selenomonas sp.]